jgi:hypothetical protein
VWDSKPLTIIMRTCSSPQQPHVCNAQINISSNQHFPLSFMYGLQLKLKQSVYSDFDAIHCIGPVVELSASQQIAMKDAAEAFNEAWRTKSLDAIYPHMLPQCHIINPIFGEKKESREEWQKVFRKALLKWESKWNEADVAITANSNKAFLYFIVRGLQKDTGEDQTIWGCNMLIFDLAGGHAMIKEVVGFRTPLTSELRGLMEG